jgi:tRNA-dihydrouridine synthase 1
VEKTLELANLLQNAGCSILTVHGRTKEMLKQAIGPNDFEIIRKIKADLRIPVFSNGGIEKYSDIEEALRLTNADGVMTSEGMLTDPTICSATNNFGLTGEVESGKFTTSKLERMCAIAQEYLDISRALPEKIAPAPTMIRAHLFKFLYPALMVCETVRDSLANGRYSVVCSA